ncbi:MAG TPA: DUF5995 family protein [Frankiaceae bacterium]|jgi:hypothetical protein|nr:DUF5995 family protein [Frankiaceae bacterium]
MRETEQTPRDVDDVVAALTEIQDALPPTDGVAAFNRMYLLVTELVRDRLAAGYFADPASMTALDVTFADLYLAAVDASNAGAKVPRAWRPLFARRNDRRLLPIQFAIAGMNAHINHDLPVAVVETCRTLGIAPDQGSFHADYDKVNALLGSVEQQVRQSFEEGVVLDADRDVAPVLDHVGNWSIDSARDAAWVNADVLWRLRDAPFALRAFEDTLAGTVGMATATLLAPV